jgi:hypothetical protein
MISEPYRELLSKAHKEDENWGTSASCYAEHVTSIINTLNLTDMLDYGAGKGVLSKSISPDHKVYVSEYDPCIEKISEEPIPHELVVCADVLEHIEPDHLYDVLNDLQRVTKKIGVFYVATGPAMKILPDGRNAHLIQEPMEWWLPKFMKRFAVQSMSLTGGGFFVVVKPYENEERH